MTIGIPDALKILEMSTSELVNDEYELITLASYFIGAVVRKVAQTKYKFELIYSYTFTPF